MWNRPFHLVVIFVLLTWTLAICDDKESLRFLVIGDWGGLPAFPYRTPIEVAVAKQMGTFANKTCSEFVLALGDNFYFDGVKDVTDSRFQESYNSVFTATSLDVEWYFVAGNHDYNGNVSAEIEYSKYMKRWMFPNYYYNLTFNIGKSTSKVEILMIDTVMLCGTSDHDFSHKQPEKPDSVIDAEAQWKWLENKLKASKAKYLIVAGHYPVLSVAEHGPTQCLTSRLMPLLYKYKVTSYFSGHDHNLQHLLYSESDVIVNYFISGAANFIDPSIEHLNDVPNGSLKFHWADILSFGGYGYVNATDTEMWYHFFEANGKELYSYKMLPRY